MMKDHTQVSNDAKNIAKNLTESIVDDVMRAILQQTGPCDELLEKIKFGLSANETDLSCVKEEHLEKPTDLKVQETLLMGSHSQDTCYSSLPEMCVISTSSLQGEGDFQQNHMKQDNLKNSSLEKNPYDKSISTSSDALAINDLSFDEVNSEQINDTVNVHLQNIKPNDFKESLLTDLSEDIIAQYIISDTSDNSEKITDAGNEDPRKKSSPPSNFKQHDKNTLTTYLTSDPFHGEIIDNLRNRLNKLSFDDIDDDKMCDNKKVHQESIRPYDLNESLLTDKEGEISSQCITSDNLENICYPLKKSKRFYFCNNTQYYPANIDQLPPNYCELVDENNKSPQLEDKINKECLDILPETYEDIDDTDDYAQSRPSTNPFRNPFFSYTTQSEIDLSPICIPSTSDNIQIQINSTVNKTNKDLLNIDWEESFEDQINVTEPQNAIGTVDIENDVIHTRTYWSNTGLIIENKVNPKCVLTLPDDFEIVSLRGLTPVKEICLKSSVNHKENYLQLGSSHISQSNGDHIKDSKVNYLSFPEKTEKKKKKSFVARLTRSISHLFSSKKSTCIEDKNQYSS